MGRWSLWEATVRVDYAADGGNQRFYRVEIANFRYGDEHKITVRDLGGASNVSATFGVGRSEGYQKHRLTVTGHVIGSEWRGQVALRRLCSYGGM
ncbi:hypothetical protein ES702_07261 [subsurface metagenome]